MYVLALIIALRNALASLGLLSSHDSLANQLEIINREAIASNTRASNIRIEPLLMPIVVYGSTIKATSTCLLSKADSIFGKGTATTLSLLYSTLFFSAQAFISISRIPCKVLIAMVLPSRSLGLAILEFLATVKTKFPLSSSLKAPGVKNLKSEPFSWAMIMDTKLEKPISSSPDSTAGAMTAPPAIGVASTLKPSSLKNPFSSATKICKQSTIAMVPTLTVSNCLGGCDFK